MNIIAYHTVHRCLCLPYLVDLYSRDRHSQSTTQLPSDLEVIRLHLGRHHPVSYHELDKDRAAVWLELASVHCSQGVFDRHELS